MAPPNNAGSSGAIHSDKAGDKPMSIGGRMVYERERTSGMTDSERAWRKQWLKDQVLPTREPPYNLRETGEFLNPIRRAYRWPLDQLFKRAFAPVIGEYPAKVARFYTGRGLMFVWAVFGSIYYFKYCTNDWTRRSGWRVIKSRDILYPGDEGYPNVVRKTFPREYNDRGFMDSIFGKKYDNAVNHLSDEGQVTYPLWRSC